jgi:hypothetical protein
MALKTTADMWLKTDLVRIKPQLFAMSGNILLAELLQAILRTNSEETVKCWYIIFWSGSQIRVHCLIAKLEDFMEVPLT